jgi:hypothetical protein
VLQHCPALLYENSNATDVLSRGIFTFVGDLTNTNIHIIG